MTRTVENYFLNEFLVEQKKWIFSFFSRLCSQFKTMTFVINFSLKLMIQQFCQQQLRYN